ncbi:MAG: sugar phosphate isomerase/epimerase [Calditrichaeota bacterium]|nr:sugar phosphate isomerase/epimerase [Calditrichota bacterium]
MKLSLYRHLWGVDDPWETVFPKIKELGYSGIESHLSQDRDQRRLLQDLMKQHDFRFIAMIFTEGKSVDEHIASFEKQIVETIGFKPVLINCHSGADAWTEQESNQFFTEVLKIESRHGIPVAHETHRGRILYNPWTTYGLLNQFLELKLCSDFSHWVCVCERLIDDQIEIIEKCAERTIHLHARVGYNEGPQVPDPRAPEYQTELETHEHWWDIIWEAQNKQGVKESTLTPEFGPPPYLQTLPRSQDPVADLWDICNWQARRQAERFSSQYQH